MKVLLIDDHAVVRHGMISLLREHFGDVTIGESGDAREGFAAALADDWDLVVVDISLPGRNGLDFIQDLRAAKPRMPVLVVSAHAERDYAVRALKLGAAGYVSKQSASEVLIAAVKRVLEGGRYVSPALAEQLAEAVSGGLSQPGHDSLSNRELQVLRLVAHGRSLKEIAADLALSEKTVSTYRARITEKMGLHTNVDIARYAMRHNLAD